MLDPLNLCRMIQKFVNKKKSVGYSHPPIVENNTVYFRIGDGEGNQFKVIVQRDDMLLDLQQHDCVSRSEVVSLIRETECPSDLLTAVHNLTSVVSK